MPGVISGLVGLAVLVLVVGLMPGRNSGRRNPAFDPSNLTEAQQNSTVAIAGALVILLAVRAVIGSWAIAILFSCGATAIPGWLVQMRRQRRNQRIGEQLEQLMGRLASGISGSGLTPEMAWVEAAAECPDAPLGPELTTIVQELQIGRTLADALRARGRHLGLPEFALIATSTAVMGNIGGNLAERYRMAAEMLTRRRANQAALQSLTLEGRASVHIIAAIPLVTFALFRAMAPEFLSPLLTTRLGLVLIAVALGIIAAGYVWGLRMAAQMDGR